MRLVFSWLMAAMLIIVIWTDGIAVEAVQYVPDEIIVKFKAGVNKANISNFNATNGVLEVATIEKIGYKVLKISPKKSVLGMVALYNQNPDVEWAEPNYIYHILTAPNDTDYYIYQYWYYNLVLAEDAWDVEKGDPNVIIAVVDSGVDLDHPDIVNKIWRNEAEYSGEDGKDDDENIYVDDIYGWDFVGTDDGDDGNQPGDNNPDVFAGDPAVGDGVNQDGDMYADDGVYHGTMVAGVAAAETDNGQGVAGTAWNCKIMAVRVMNPEGNGNAADITSGIIYAADNGANVINLSLGSDESSSAIEAAIAYAETKDCVVVAAAGNSKTNPIDYPARYSETHNNLIAVGASDHGTADPNDHHEDDGRALFSSWGTGDTGDPLVDVVAPGIDIRTTTVQPVTGTAFYSIGDGTSFSAPIVSGLAALVISSAGATDPEVVRAYIKDGASDLPDDPNDSPDAGPNWDGSGMVQFAHTDSLPVTLSAFTATKTQDGKVLLRWTTETEVNNIGWNIYRSVNKADSFIKINDFVSGAGNSAFPNDYQYVDKNVVSGVTYFYYIEDVDIQGQRSKSAIVKTTLKTEIVPTDFQIFQNYPNPFNPATWIPYQLAENAEVTIWIYNIAGQLIRTLELGNKKIGFYLSKEKSAYWNGKNDNNQYVAGGVYFYQIKAGKQLTSIRKMVLLK